MRTKLAAAFAAIVTLAAVGGGWWLLFGGPEGPTREELAEAAVAAYAEAWLDLERRGGGPEIGALAEVVTDRFARSLRGFAPHDPVADPPPFTDFDVTKADRTTVTGRACRSNQLQEVEWVLVDGQWRIDFVGQIGQEPTPCP
jgi:hypothetical protein